MDVAAGYVPMNLESVATNSMIVEDNGGESLSHPPAKRQRFGEEMNRVAEIVLVLSALGRMRGGETPTKFELELMLEARSKLAAMCQEFTPTDIICKDNVKAVTEDLGLNGKLKDKRLGFRAPKLTISEKLSLGKIKMEEAKKYPTSTVSTGYALSQRNGSVASPGLANKASVAHQWPSREVSTVNTSGSHLKMERPQIILNGASQGTPISSANYYAAPWSAQPQSTISFSTAPDKKVPIQNSVRVANPSFRPFMSQTPHGTFPGTNQPMHYGQTSSFENNHSKIAKIIQKFLQTRVKQYPLWNPPSREYMSRAMTCQMCDVTIKEMDTLLICDACEKAYHLKCLQANNINGVPKSEWYCSICVQASKGKPFLPTYGRTARAITTTAAKVSSSTPGLQSSSAKKIESMDIKVNQEKPIVTTTPRVQHFPGFFSGAATTSHFETASVNANTTASAAKTTNIGSQRYRESVICGANSPALVSLTETPNLTAIAHTSSVINNGLISKPLTPVGTMSITSLLRVGNQVHVNATSSASPSTPITSSFVSLAPTVTQNGDSSSTASGTANHSISNADLTTQVHTLTVTSSCNSQPALSHSEDAKATDDAAPMKNVVDEPQAPLENVAECENPSESASHSDSLKDAREKFASGTCQNHATESLEAVLSDQDLKITAEPSKPQEHSAYLSEKTASQPPSVSSNHHSQIEKETPDVQDSLQNVLGDSQEGKSLNGLD